jgi:hypothetical protein
MSQLKISSSMKEITPWPNDEIDQTDQTDQIDQMDEIDQIEDVTRKASSKVLDCLE